MPELIEQMYCSQQIVIPPKFPYILKRFCKAAIKTQPYDLLRWSYEYFKAMAENRPPPVKLRLEYPVYSTEGGLTRGCLKVLAKQLSPMSEIPLPVLRAAWGGFCLDQMELRRVLCLCEVHMREDAVPFLHFIAVAGGLLTKTLTHTMILLCECLTKEPDGGSAAIPVEDFLTMYLYLAKMDASKDVKYYNGYKEGETPVVASVADEEPTIQTESHEETSSDDFWLDSKDTQKIPLINDRLARTNRLSVRLGMPILGKIERSPSVERAGQIERENYTMESRGRAVRSGDVDRKLREMSESMMSNLEVPKDQTQAITAQVIENFPEKEGLEIVAHDEDDNEIPIEFYGEPNIVEEIFGEEETEVDGNEAEQDKTLAQEDEVGFDIETYVAEPFTTALTGTLKLPGSVGAPTTCYAARQDRLRDLEQTFDDIAAIVDRFKSASYDLGMVAGRQMSTTSGEFIAQHIEQEIMEYIDEQIAILPDPDMKKKKAKPEEVEMVRHILDKFLDENIDVIAPEVEEVEEEEQPLPDIVTVYAVPGIGAPVDDEILKDFKEYALDVCKVQADMFMPRNIRHFMCPPLEHFEEYKPDSPETQGTPKLEEVATSGIITE